jgi:hypothetical protein
MSGVMPSSKVDQDPQLYTEYRTPTREQITRKAHELWEQAGRPEGQANEHWLAAERALQFPSEVNEQVTPAVAPTPEAPTSPVGKPARRAAVAQRSSGSAPPRARSRAT